MKKVQVFTHKNLQPELTIKFDQLETYFVFLVADVCNKARVSTHSLKKHIQLERRGNFL